MIFLYYDKYGKLKEWINDATQREGNSNYNTIYWYMEEEPDFTSKTITFERGDGTKSTEYAVTQTETRSVPYSKTRNYVYFKDYVEYTFNKFVLNSDILSTKGAYKGTIRNLNADETIFSLGEFSFNVENSVIKDDANIPQSQYDYLWTLWSDLKADTSEALVNTEKALEEIETKLNAALTSISEATSEMEDTIATSLSQMEGVITTTLDKVEQDTASAILELTNSVNEAIADMETQLANALEKLKGFDIGGVSLGENDIHLVDTSGFEKENYKNVLLGNFLKKDSNNKLSVDIEPNSGNATNTLTTIRIGSTIYKIPTTDTSGLAGLTSDNVFTGANTFDATLGINIGSVHLTEAGLTELEKQAEKIPTIESKANNAIPSSEKGAANGVATLDSTGKVSASQLPEDFAKMETYPTKNDFPATGDDNIIYVAEDTNITYRWSGSAYVATSSSLALGETAETAYAGDKGKKNADDIATLNTELESVKSSIPKGIKYDNGFKVSTNASDTVILKTVNGQSLVGSGNIESLTNVSPATNTTLGGIKANAKTDKDLVKANIGSDDFLYVDTEPYGEFPIKTTLPSGDLSGIERIFEQDGKLYAVVSDDFVENSYSFTIDDELNLTSTNAVQNKVITQAITEIYADKQDNLSSSQLNAVNSGITATKVNKYDAYETSKQDKLIAGENISIVGNVISATGGSGESYTAGDGITISSNVISAKKQVSFEITTNENDENVLTIEELVF